MIESVSQRVVVLAMLCAAVCAQEPDALLARFTQAIEEIDARGAELDEKLKAQMMVGILQVEKTAQAGGDLDTVLACREYRKQLEAGQVAAGGKAGENPQLQKARQTYFQQRAHAQAALRQEKKGLLDRFSRGCDQQVKQQTQGGNVEKAIAFRELKVKAARLAGPVAPAPAPVPPPREAPPALASGSPAGEGFVINPDMGSRAGWKNLGANISKHGARDDEGNWVDWFRLRANTKIMQALPAEFKGLTHARIYIRYRFSADFDVAAGRHGKRPLKVHFETEDGRDSFYSPIVFKEEERGGGWLVYDVKHRIPNPHHAKVLIELGAIHGHLDIDEFNLFPPQGLKGGAP